MSNPMDSVDKDPQAVLTYGFDWAALGWLPEGETVGDGSGGTTAPVWTIATENGSVDDELVSDDEFTNDPDNTQSLITLSGGTDGVDYIVRALITTTPSGIKDARSIRVRVRTQ